MEKLIAKLIDLGFEDVSSDKNGMGYRRRLPGEMMEICYYVPSRWLRFQTKRSGVTMELKGVDTVEDLKLFWKFITGEDFPA